MYQSCLSTINQIQVVCMIIDYKSTKSIKKHILGQIISSYFKIRYQIIYPVIIILFMCIWQKVYAVVKMFVEKTVY